MRAVIFREGHDVLAAQVELFAEGISVPEAVADLELGVSDEWQATVVPRRLGRHQLVAAGLDRPLRQVGQAGPGQARGRPGPGEWSADGAAVLRRAPGRSRAHRRSRQWPRP